VSGARTGLDACCERGAVMDVMQAIKGRRSIRKYKPDPVSDETVNTVLEAARWAPSLPD